MARAMSQWASGSQPSLIGRVTVQPVKVRKRFEGAVGVKEPRISPTKGPWMNSPASSPSQPPFQRQLVEHNENLQVYCYPKHLSEGFAIEIKCLSSGGFSFFIDQPASVIF